MIDIIKYEGQKRADIFPETELDSDIYSSVNSIIADVRKNKDKAVLEYTKKFDKADIDRIKVSEDEIFEAINGIDWDFLSVLERAAFAIERFHKNQKRTGFSFTDEGTLLGQKITPIEKVGLYVPGGTAAYPSTVLMNVIPAKLAGCKHIAIATPPGKDGRVNPIILAAAHIVGIKTVYKMGGAQAIAALAYGTETVKKVDKIVGPGNAYVAEAKRQVFGKVAIDMIAGPSEIMIISDSKSDPVAVAADLLSQAEHDKMASSVLVTDSEEFASLVSDALEEMIPTMERRDIARESIDRYGKIIIVPDIEQAFQISDEIAPEHLEVCLDDAEKYLDKINNAGSVFLGRYTPEALGDYRAGPNHTLPTSGTAKFSSPLSVDDFIKKTQYSHFTPESFEKIADEVIFFAEKEGLYGHANSVKVRMKGNNE